MFRTTSCVLNVKTLLYCRRPNDCQIAIARLLPQNASHEPRPRKPCPVQPPTPLPQTKDVRWMWGGVAVLLIAGYSIVCAHDSPEIRDWLTLYAPWIDDFIAILYQENITYRELAIHYMIDIKNRLDWLKPDSQKQSYPDKQSIADVSRNARISQSDDGNATNATR